MIPHWLYDYAAGAVLICSALYTFLPPWEFLNDFPQAQKFYKVFVYLVGYVGGGTARSAVYKSIRNGGDNVQK